MEKKAHEKYDLEMHRLMADSRKLLLEGDFYVKKLRWYEVVLIFGAGLAVATMLLKL